MRLQFQDQLYLLHHCGILEMHNCQVQRLNVNFGTVQLLEYFSHYIRVEGKFVHDALRALQQGMA